MNQLDRLMRVNDGDKAYIVACTKLNSWMYKNFTWIKSLDFFPYFGITEIKDVNYYRMWECDTFKIDYKYAGVDHGNYFLATQTNKGNFRFHFGAPFIGVVYSGREAVQKYAVECRTMYAAKYVRQAKEILDLQLSVLGMQ